MSEVIELNINPGTGQKLVRSSDRLKFRLLFLIVCKGVEQLSRRGFTSNAFLPPYGTPEQRAMVEERKDFGPLARKPVSEVEYADRWGVAWPN